VVVDDVKDPYPSPGPRFHEQIDELASSLVAACSTDWIELQLQANLITILNARVIYGIHILATNVDGRTSKVAATHAVREALSKVKVRGETKQPDELSLRVVRPSVGDPYKCQYSYRDADDGGYVRWWDDLES
jgi:hypothetical protein